MKSSKTCVFVLLFSLALPASAQQASPTTTAAKKWLDALELRRSKFDRLMAKLKQAGDPGGGVPRELFCPIALESALALALTEAHLMNGGNEDFHLLFHGARKDQFLDVTYSYDSRGTLLLTGVHRLPDDWAVGMQPGDITAGKFIVITDDATRCIFQFDSADPFASKAIVAEQE